ncbi:hypothetical protein BKA58DRAFT_448249 [Alternaria rosae]|uniref:uncharacterized protein n=1 Tax=Alternaria rosae TaxID=1187941 RepID=UPI001E8E437A|nr:uncharacterized protein BKA58DRAFT_448249 [Alternaria rosae]KAH6860615.1 hypothetical protein BKA58DRAFT_448249 [Alternaria rosae]
MKLLATITFFGALAAAAPILEDRAATTTAKTSSALKTSSAAAVVKSSSAVAVATSKTSSAAAVVTSKASSAAVVSKASSSAIVSKASSAVISVITSKASSAASTTSTITAAPTTAPSAAPTALPSTFSAPVQGQGKLTLDNLPAMPAVIDNTFSGVLGAAYGLMSGACDASYRCNITVAGTISNLLVDGNNYGTNTSVVAWCEGGRCYGTASAPVTATAPFVITCDQLSGTQVCSATISGAANAIFQNGQSVELWGWLTPAGYCQNGVCTASITAVGDPMY